jgi:hypothetical protein
MQIDNVAVAPAILMKPMVGTITPGSIAAGGAEVSHTGQPVDVNDTGFVFFHPSVTPANAVRPGTFRCTTAGTAIVTYVNPTAGALTPTASTATTPYLLVVVKSGT